MEAEGTGWKRYVRGCSETARLLLLVFSSLVLAAWVVWLTVPARWTTTGYPSYVGYAKNIEHTALFAGAVTALGLVLALAGRKLPWLYLGPVSLAAFGVAIYYGTPEVRYALPMLLTLCLPYFVWFWHARLAAVTDSELKEPWPKQITIALLVLVSAAFFLRSVWPVGLDGFHQGEVVITAQDWLEGGRPYETLFWPHGFHDSWQTAQWMRLTGNYGVGSFTMSRATSDVLGVIALFTIACCLLRRYAEALILATVAGLTLPYQVAQIGVCSFALWSLMLLAHRCDWRSCLGAGALLGCGFLWRFDSGLIGLVSATGYLLFLQTYQVWIDKKSLIATISAGEWWRGWSIRCGAVWGGVVGSLAAIWLATGVPSARMLRMLLLDMPRYHADNTGLPLPIPIARFEQFIYIDHWASRWTVAAYLLFLVVLAAVLVRKVYHRQLSLAGPAERFFLVYFLFLAIHSKSILDRSGLERASFAVTQLTTLIVCDFLARTMQHRRITLWRPALVAMASIACFGIAVPQSTAREWFGFRHTIASAKHTIKACTSPLTLRYLRTCLTPASDWQGLIEPSHYPRKEELIQGVSKMRTLIAEHGIGKRQLLAVHSGPLFYPLLGLETPTRYYMLGWAMNERMQHEAVAELEQRQLKAVLRLNGLGGVIPEYDVPDEHRVPIIDRYLRNHYRNWPALGTRLGRLHIDAPNPAEYWTVAGAGQQWQMHTPEGKYPIVDGAVSGSIDHLTATPDGTRMAGWAAWVAHAAPADKLAVVLGDQVIFVMDPLVGRPDVVAYFQNPEIMDCGFDILLPEAMFPSARASEARVFALSRGTISELPWPARPAAMAAQPESPKVLR